MTRQYRLFETIDQVPIEEWSAVCESSPSCYMTPNFLRSIEKTLPDQARVWHALVYDETGRPAACASLCLLPVDLLTLASQQVRDRVAWIRNLLPRLGQIKVLMCGLPFSAGQSNLVFAPGADRAQALRVLHGLMLKLARRERASVLVFKEFATENCPDMDGLGRHGYWRADSPAMYELVRPFRSFAAYRDALKTHYRANIRRSQRKFEEAGCRFVRLDTLSAIEQVYTPELHRLYEAVVNKSDLKLEVLSRAFFLELVRQFPGRVSLTVVYRADSVVGFTWELADGRDYHFLFMGLDHAQNTQADLYFNMVYQSLDNAFCSGAEIIHVGQTADAFKTLLGCTGKPRYIYARGVGSMLASILRKCAPLLFPARPPVPGHDVFKAEPAPSRKSPVKKQKTAAPAAMNA